MENPVDWFNILSNLGFPAVLVFYLLIRLEKRLDDFENTIENLINDKQKNIED